jgi:YD repeat-containing protein
MLQETSFESDGVTARISRITKRPEAIRACPSTRRGTSLAQMKALARSVGVAMVMGRRPAGAAVIVPALVHWKVGHFAALVAQTPEKVLVRDPTFGDELWVSRHALDQEASGYFLVMEQTLPAGWTAVDEAEGATVWGKGQPAGSDPTDVGGGGNGPPPECGGGCMGGAAGGGGNGGRGPRGMPVATIHLMLVSLTLRDAPVGYAPPKGPAVEFLATYNQRESSQPQTFSYANLGPKWTFDWLSYLEDDPANPSSAVSVYFRGGGRETSSGYDGGTQTYAPTVRNQAVVRRVSTSPLVYERGLGDGSVEVFGQPDGAMTYPRKVFLTARRDPQGNEISFTWDAQLRLVAVTDALGQVTTLGYEHASDPLKITKVTDPFGRVATFTYDTAGRLQSLTDVLGLTSTFAYGANDVITAMTTPYGTTTMTVGEDGVQRWAELTDPLGGKERVFYSWGITYSEPSTLVPTGMQTHNASLDHHNTLYWDKRAMAVAPGEPASATDYHWAIVSSGLSQAAAVPLSVKRPLENRVWYNYQGGGATTEGTVRRVTAVGRVLDDGTTQLWKYEYNTRGQMTKLVDPLGRETV